MRVPASTRNLSLLCRIMLPRVILRPACYAQGDDTGAPPTSSTQTWSVIIIGVSNQRRLERFCWSARGVRHSACTASHGQAGLPPIGFNPESAGERRRSNRQFVHVPAGDCRVEVSAAATACCEHTEVPQSVTNRVQYVYVYLHPESELGTGARPAVVPDKALKEIDKGSRRCRTSTTPKR